MPARSAGVDVMLDAIHALPDHAGADFAGLIDRLADDGVEIIASPAKSERFWWRSDAPVGTVAQTAEGNS